MENEELCISCQRPKATFSCGLCESALCKRCFISLAEDAFSFQTIVDPGLKHLRYCPICYDRDVAPALEAYQATMERARAVYFFFSTQRKPFHLIKRAQYPMKIESCPDRNETILRMGFIAAEQGFNAVIEADISAAKVRMQGWQTSNWSGRGFAAKVDGERLDRDAERDQY